MTPDIIELVKSLSLSDTKTLSQKVLKLFEEGGELSSVVLPYETAAGTLHRIAHKGQIVEELADILLVALSIAYSMGVSDDTLDSVMLRKALYWAELQKNEGGVDKDKIPHEIHVTVASASSLAQFRADCASIGVKPVVLALHTKDSATLQDVMTSQVVLSNTTDAFRAMYATEHNLAEMGYTVLRSKIEVAPWHPSVPTESNKLPHHEDNYFESHIEVYVDDESQTTNITSLKNCVGSVAHVSGNYFKMGDAGRTVMVTMRWYSGYLEAFKVGVAGLKDTIKAGGFAYNERDIIEYSIFDSKLSHDNRWTGE
jgi:NTP pyrophosphatase (non-canonical NTP hydrolase)